MIRSSIKRIAVGLALAGTVAAVGGGGNLAHAAAGGPRICPRVTCYPAPSLVLSGEHGEVYVDGYHWAANRWLELDVYAPVSSNLPSVVTYFVHTGANGAFSTAYVAPGGCFDQQLEFQAIDSVANTVVTQYAVPGCIA